MVRARARVVGTLWACLAVGCAASGRSDRPVAPAPAPSGAAIATLGFDQAVRMGSDYVHQSAGYGSAVLASSQELPGGLVELNFDLGPDARPVRLVVNRVTGNVETMEQVQPIPGVVVPAKKP